jgi:hypothetical protein
MLSLHLETKAPGGPPPDAEPPGALDPIPTSLAGPAGEVGLSNDYLNPYSEALMLIEMAPDAPDVVSDLAAWRPVSYRAYFGASALRRAPAALAAYDRLPPEPRRAFEDLVQAMDMVARTARTALQPPSEPEDAALVAAITGPALRRLIDRAASFLNSGGQDLPGDDEVEKAQEAIDRLIDRLGADEAAQG